MMMRFANVSAEGVYTPPPPANSKASYATMMFVRADIVKNAGRSAAPHAHTLLLLPPPPTCPCPSPGAQHGMATPTSHRECALYRTCATGSGQLRILILILTCSYLAKAVTIATRYCAVRRQTAPGPGQRELQVRD